MIIQDIYYRFSTPSNLQDHMLRVGALAEIICSSWTGKNIENNSIVQACLLHDIAKPLNFDLAKQAKFGLSETDINNLEKLQQMIREKYDSNEHKAVVKICREIGCPNTAVEIVDDLEWEHTTRLLSEKKTESLIAIYCDMRISPKGILPLVDRMNELKTRDHDSNRMDELSLAGQELEKWIQSNTSIDLNSIDNHQINSKIELLRKLVF